MKFGGFKEISEFSANDVRQAVKSLQAADSVRESIFAERILRSSAKRAPLVTGFQVAIIRQVEFAVVNFRANNGPHREEDQVT